ncbi:MAG: plastocyanin/azurin family copper-binding protein [Chloroflexi bacterium]|nr:plastocyanin/azurin family copper-binding protein [Chloroflexota bacterium]
MRRIKEFTQQHIAYVLFAGALAVGFAFGVVGNLPTTDAQDEGSQTFVVEAGGAGLGPAEALIFAPASFQVHRGDTVTWKINGFHNIRFPEEGLIPFVLFAGDDVEVSQINPDVAFPTIEGGAAYTGGPTNSGLPASMPGGPTDTYGTFSLVIDLEPGSYNYLCDVHPGMVGVINVAEDGVEIPGPTDVMLQAKSEIDATLGMGSEVVQADIESSFGGVNTADDSGMAHVQTGTGDTGRTTVNRFFAFTTVIEERQSVTWTIPEGSADPHTVTWPPYRGQDVAPIPQDEGPPLLSFGPGFTADIPENASVTQGVTFNSGIMLPGQSFTLTFAEAGAYPFVCNIHPGMEGTVVVVPASE